LKRRLIFTSERLKILSISQWHKPLGFAFDPDAALREVLKVKPPRDWRKVIKTGRRNCR
jgi:hypothetical protein